MFPLVPSTLLFFISCYYFFTIFQTSFNGLIGGSIFYSLILSAVIYFGFKPPKFIKNPTLLSSEGKFSVSINNLSINNVSIDILWSWVLSKLFSSVKTSPPIIFSISGIHLVLSLKPNEKFETSTSENKALLIDDVVRSMHRRIAVMRPFTAFLWLFGFNFKDIKIEIVDHSLHSTIFEITPEVFIKAGRVDSNGEHVFLIVNVNGQSKRNGSFCRCEMGEIGLTKSNSNSSLELEVQIAYPTDIRTIKGHVLLPSKVALSLPNIYITSKQIDGFTSMMPYFGLFNDDISSHSTNHPTSTLEISQVLNIIQLIDISFDINSLTFENSDYGKLVTQGWSLVSSNGNKSASFFLKSLSVFVPCLLRTNTENRSEEVASLNDLKLEANIDESSDVFNVGIAISLDDINARVERSALIIVNKLITQFKPNSQDITTSTVSNNVIDSSAGVEVSSTTALPPYSLFIDISLPKLNIVAPMTEYLLDAKRNHKGDVNLAMRVYTIEVNIIKSTNINTSCKLKLDKLLFEEINVDKGQCLIVEELKLVMPFSEELGHVDVQVGAVRGRWSPLVTKCVGTMAGGIARELFDVMFDRDTPSPISALTEAVLKSVANPFTQDQVDHLLQLDSNYNDDKETIAVVIACKVIELEFPFKLWEDPNGECGGNGLKCGAFLKTLEDIYGEGTYNDELNDWECVAVKVNGGTVVVKTPLNELPIIQMQLRSTELYVSGLNEWNQLSRSVNHTTNQPMIGCCIKCNNFALESFSDRVVELCMSKIDVRWSPAMQIRILKVARDVTFSVWESLLCYRILKYLDKNPTLMINRPLEDARELISSALKFKQLISAAGEKLNRLYADTIHIEFASASPLENSTCFANVRVGRLWSLDLPEMWNIQDVSVSLAGHPTLNLQSLSFSHTLDRSPTLFIGAALKELRTRYHVIENKLELSDIDKEAMLLAKKTMQSIIPTTTEGGGHEEGGGGKEGFLIELKGLNIRVGTKFKIADTVSDEAVQLQALVSALLSLPGRWIPGCEDFKRLFSSSTTYESILFGQMVGPEPAPEMWIKLRKMDMSLGDEPMEAWLERAYPLWLDELERRSLREEQLRKRIVAIKVSNSTLGATTLIQKAEEEFLEYDAIYYMERIKKEKINFNALKNEISHKKDEQRADKLCVSVSSCDIHAIIPKLEENENDETDDIRSNGKRRGFELIRSLDSNPPPLEALFDVFTLSCFEIAAIDLSVTVRKFKTPIFASEAVKLKGCLLLTTTQAPYPECYYISQVKIDQGMASQTVSQCYELPRVYLDFTGHVSHPVASYSPAYEFGLEELAATCGALYPDSMTLDPQEKLHSLRWWDSGRRLITTRMDMSADDLHLSLLPSLSTYHHRYVSTTVSALSTPALNVLNASSISNDFISAVNQHIASGAQEELRIVCDLLQLRYERLNVYTDVRGMRCFQVPAPINMLPLASLPSALLTMSYEWECKGDAANYHFYPIVCENGEVVDLTSPRNQGEPEDKFASFRSHGLRLKLSAKLSPNSEPIKLHFNGDCSPLFPTTLPTSSVPRTIPTVEPPVSGVKDEKEISDPVIVVYASSLAWLVNWASSFKRIPNVPYPAKCRPALDSGIWGLKAHIRGISLENTGVQGIVKLVILDKPRTGDQESEGVEVSVFGSSVSMQVSEEVSYPNPFLTGKLSTDPDDLSRLWVVHGVSVSVGKIEGSLIKTQVEMNSLNQRKFGFFKPQGLFLFSAASLSFNQSVVSSEGVTLRHSLESNRKTDHPIDGNEEELNNQSPRSKHAGLYGAADSYLNAVSIDDVRVCITVEARDSLISFGERVVSILKDSLLDEEKPRDDLVIPIKDDDNQVIIKSNALLYSIKKIDEDNEQNHDKTSPAPAPHSSLDTMGGLFLIRVTSIQVQALDLDSKASILIALPSLIAQGWIGQTSEVTSSSTASNLDLDVLPRQSRSESMSHRGGIEEMLQRLIRKELPRYVEATHIQIKGMSLLEAPSDLDGVSEVRWLPTYTVNMPGVSGINPAPWNTGVFNTLLEPVSVIEVGVVVEHGAVPIHSLRVALPTIDVKVDSDAMRRVVKVATAMSTLPTKENNKEETSTSPLPSVPTSPVLSESARLSKNMQSESAISVAWRLKQAEKWKLNNLRRLLRSLMLILGSNQFNHSEEVPGLEMSSLTSWISSTEKHIETAIINLEAASTSLARLVSDTKRMLQVQPHMHLVAFIGGVRVGLITLARKPIATLALDRISAIFANFLDQSGSLELDLYKVTAHFHNEDGGSNHDVLEALDESCVRRIGSTMRKGGLGSRMYLWDHVESMIRVQARLGTLQEMSSPSNNNSSPVMPFMDIRHFEVVIVPLFIHLTRRFVVSMSDFFIPPNEAIERKHDDQSRDAFLHGNKANKHQTTSRSLSLSLSTSSVSNSSLNNPTSPPSGGSVDSVGSIGSSKALLFGGGGDNDDSSSKHSVSSNENKLNNKDDSSLLKKRTHIQYLRLGQLVAFVSYKGENWAKLEDFDALQVKIHPYVVRDKTVMFGELALGIRNHVVMDILSQVNRNFVNIGAFLATKFSGMGTCTHHDWSAGAVIPVHEKNTNDDNEDDDEEGYDEYDDGILKGSRRNTTTDSEGSSGGASELSTNQPNQSRLDMRSNSDPMIPQDRTVEGGRDLLLGANKSKKRSSLLGLKSMSLFGKK